MYSKRDGVTESLMENTPKTTGKRDFSAKYLLCDTNWIKRGKYLVEIRWRYLVVDSRCRQSVWVWSKLWMARGNSQETTMFLYENCVESSVTASSI